jgi:RNA polymerase sigma-70 factor (ECF subfamily)
MSDIEEKIRAAHQAGNIKTAASIALESYGQELFGFIANCVGHSSDAEDIFSLFCEDFWQGFGGFKWRSSFRTWAYSLARNATWRHLSRPQRRRDRNIPLSEVPEVLEIADRIRTSTAAYLRTTHKQSIRNIRKLLPVEEQMLLILRVDRALTWRDIAIVMEGEQLAQDEAASKKSETRLRKRFERVKEKLRDMAHKEGLL